MKTIYGEVSNKLIIAYVNGLTNKIFKLLPMKEETSSTLSQYLESLLRELIGAKELIFILEYNQDITNLLVTLQSLLSEDDLLHYKSDVFKCLSLVKRIKSSLSGDDE